MSQWELVESFFGFYQQNGKQIDQHRVSLQAEKGESLTQLSRRTREWLHQGEGVGLPSSSKGYALKVQSL